jgi:hypothetical protein
MTQPLVVNNPVGLVICGDSSALYLAHVPDPGAENRSRSSTSSRAPQIHELSFRLCVAGWMSFVSYYEVAFLIPRGPQEQFAPENGV